MDPPKPVCEHCGQPAVVHVTSEGPGGTGVRHLCLNCADIEDTVAHREELGLNRAAVLLAAGLMILTISLLADVLRFGQAEGFGYKQLIGLVLAVGGVLMGAVIRVPTLSAVGIVIGGLAIAADYAGFGSHPGFGWQQVAGAALGLILVAAGLLKARRR